MNPQEICYLNIPELAALFKTKQLSPVEATRHMLARIDKLDPELHPYARLMKDRALAAAKAAESAFLRGESTPILMGIPLAVKDNFDTAGVVSANGMVIHKNRVPTTDSTSVIRLENLGAALLGKLQQTEGAFAEHEKTVTVPVNPWNADYWSGASSSGSGVAPAAGLTFASLGTDTGGSVRFPCAANGLTGIKPTWGRISRHGVYPNSPSMDHVGPMARSVGDVAIILEAISGQDPLDPTASHLSVPRYRPGINKNLGHLRVGIDPSYSLAGVAAEIVDGMKRAISIFKTFGIEVEETQFPDTAQVIEDWFPMSEVEMAAAHEGLFEKNKGHYGAALTSLIQTGHSEGSLSFHNRLMRRHRFRGSVDAFFAKFDILIVPTQSFLPPTVRQMAGLGVEQLSIDTLVRFTAPFDMTGSPTFQFCPADCRRKECHSPSNWSAGISPRKPCSILG